MEVNLQFYLKNKIRIKLMKFALFILLFFFTYHVNAEMNQSYSGCKMHNFGYCRLHAKYGQRVSIKSKTEAIKYVKDFYKENGFDNIIISSFIEKPSFFKINVNTTDNKLNDKIILNKFDGRIRFLNINYKKHKSCIMQ